MFIFAALILTAQVVNGAGCTTCALCYRCTSYSGCNCTNCVYDANYCDNPGCPIKVCPGGFQNPITCECDYIEVGDHCPYACGNSDFYQTPYPECKCVCTLETCPAGTTLNTAVCKCIEDMVCEPGYYKTPFGCQLCPTQEPDECGTMPQSSGANIASCYIPSGSSCADITGQYTITQNCSYKQ